MNPLLQLLEYGQSYWLDNLTRGKLLSGELRHRVANEGLRGLTSNPTIFHKAISGSSDYDAQIRGLAEQHLPTHDIYERVVISDIQAACDVLRPVYDESNGIDGYVSLEVSPHYASDTQSSIEEARHLHALVQRPNLFIKIPGSPAGVSAIEELLFQGININITLLFSIDAYESIAYAYIRALERRADLNLPLDAVASVASFFLSRIDTLVDKLLQERIQARVGAASPRPDTLLGKAGIANAKLAYQRFKQICATSRWHELAAKGARVQRMLWASTSTKNPAYRDVMYVEPLIGPHTVNTMPDETIAAFADHGVVAATIGQDVDAAEAVMRDLATLGIDFHQVTDQLLREGVQKFIEPHDELHRGIEEKRQRLIREYRARPQEPARPRTGK